MIDERLEETAALHALDLLEGAELAAFERELARDARLREHVSRLRAAAENLAHLAPPATPSAFLRDRILSSAAAQGTAPSKPAKTANRPSPSYIAFSAALGWATAACLAIATGYFAIQSSGRNRELQTLRNADALSQLDTRALRNQLEAERLIAQRQIADLKLAAGRIVELERQSDIAQLKIASLASLAGNSPEAQAIAVWNPSTQEGVLTVSKLPALAQDKDYQLWVVDPQYPIPVDGGVFAVDSVTGEARIRFKPNRPVKTAAKFAVSLERKGGVPKAEGPMVLISN